MSKKKVYYLSYYDTEDRDRVHALSCTNIMNYIIYVLNKLGYEVERIICTDDEHLTMHAFLLMKD